MKISTEVGKKMNKVVMAQHRHTHLSIHTGFDKLKTWPTIAPTRCASDLNPNHRLGQDADHCFKSKFDASTHESISLSKCFKELQQSY